MPVACTLAYLNCSLTCAHPLELIYVHGVQRVLHPQTTSQRWCIGDYQCFPVTSRLHLEICTSIHAFKMSISVQAGR
jgi:hypothetical protein